MWRSFSGWASHRGRSIWCSAGNCGGGRGRGTHEVWGTGGRWVLGDGKGPRRVGWRHRQLLNPHLTRPGLHQTAIHVPRGARCTQQVCAACTLPGRQRAAAAEGAAQPADALTSSEGTVGSMDDPSVLTANLNVDGINCGGRARARGRRDFRTRNQGGKRGGRCKRTATGARRRACSPCPLLEAPGDQNSGP